MKEQPLVGQELKLEEGEKNPKIQSDPWNLAQKEGGPPEEMKLRICLEGVCFLKAFRFTATDLKPGLCFSSSSCRSARGESATLACASMPHTELFLGLGSEVVHRTRPGGKAALSFWWPKWYCKGAQKLFLSLPADKPRRLLASSFPCAHRDLCSAGIELDFAEEPVPCH